MNKQKKQKTEMTSEPGTSTDQSAEMVVQIPVVKKIQYPPTGKSEKILEKLHAVRHEGEFCDVQLKYSNSKTVYAHKAILATCSPYFEGMFGSAFMEATSEVVDLSHITDREDVLENVIDTFYGRRFELNEGNVSETLNLATMLLLDELKEACANVLFGLADIKNAAQMLQLSLNFELPELRDKVVPMVNSRFHDYILFQDDLLDLSVEGFELLLKTINTSYISRRVNYINFILKWFRVCEGDERASLLEKAIKEIQFKITKHSYEEFEKLLEDVINHLDDVNSDVTDEIKATLSKRLPSLKPNDYIKNLSPELEKATDDKIEKVIGGRIKEDSDSELEDEPERELYNTFGVQLEVYGPPTKKQGFTKKEEAAWAKAHADMADRDQHRIWAKKWPMDLLNKLGTHDDPNRPKHIKRESPPEIFKSRNFRVKSADELAEEANLVEALVVLSPSKGFLQSMESKQSKTDDFTNDMLEVCAYVPRKHAWYKITSISASSLKKKFNSGGKYEGSAAFRRGPRPDNPDSDDDDDSDEEAIHLSAMMDMYGSDMPEMVMIMRGMSSSRRRRFMEEAMRGRMPPSMLRRMMEMDMDDDDDHHRREYMMMREMPRMHRRWGPFGMEMMHMMRPRTTKIPSLTDPKWNAVYLKHRLYFYNQDIHDSVFCYDILNEMWYKSDIKYSNEKPEQGYIDRKDGIELIVMGQRLHAVLRITVFDNRRDYHWKSKEDKVEESKRQEVNVKHVVYRMVGELGDAKWEKVMENDGHHEYIPIDKERRLDPENEKHGRRYMEYEMGPVLRQPDSLKTVLYAEDEEKLFVCSAVRKRYYKDETVVGYCVTHIDLLYLDLKKYEYLLSSPDRQIFLRQPTPLYGDDIVAFVNDDLVCEFSVDVGKPGPWGRVLERGCGEPEKNSEFFDARKEYPRCPSLLFSAGDGKSLWILRGKEDDTSETIEVRSTMFYQSRRCNITTTKHPPPPFKCFTMAMATKIDKTIVRSFGHSTKYLHLD